MAFPIPNMPESRGIPDKMVLGTMVDEAGRDVHRPCESIWKHLEGIEIVLPVFQWRLLVSAGGRSHGEQQSANLALGGTRARNACAGEISLATHSHF